MPFFDLSILDVLPQVVADGSKGGVHLYAEVTPKAYGGFIYWAFLFRKEKSKKEPVSVTSDRLFFNLYLRAVCDDVVYQKLCYTIF